MINIQNIICGYEREIVRWIKIHYKELGYEEIIKADEREFPDFVMLRNGKKIRVEVEIYSNYFLKHKHDIQKVDEILCIVDDAKLSIKTIEIKQLRLWYHLRGDDLIDFFKQSPDNLLINHRTGETIHHFQDDWLNLTKEREIKIRKNLNEEAKLKAHY
jgi:hypothetical protein|tara:strand:- start:2221 stop:2697 length:477 start_codon:yes stop_codon:yes gene_type:complete